jgi:hypothetical protein
MKLCSIDSMRDLKHKITLLLSLCLLPASTVVLPAGRVLGQGSQPELVTLHSPNKYRNSPRKFCVQFHEPAKTTEPCDLYYGYLYAGDDWDWFQSSTVAGNRSVIKDLGVLNWTDSLRVEAVEPLPKLAPGEQRQITIDTSGADGKDGAPGAPGQAGADADGIIRNRQVLTVSGPVESSSPTKPKRDGKPRIDPLFVKAVIGHLYVIHVVDESRDFYALFRVENLERGDNCTISWRLISPPRTLERLKNRKTE